MDSIDRFAAQYSLPQNIYLTQGVYETVGEFACRSSGFQANFAGPDNYLRRMSSGSSNSSQGSFKVHFGYASALEEYHSLPDEGVCAGQLNYFHLREDTLKHASSHSNDRADQASIEQPEIHSRYREVIDKPKKTVFKRLLNFLTRCFMPCIKVKT